MHPYISVRQVFPFVAGVLAAGPSLAQSGTADLDRITCFFETARVVQVPALVACTLSGGTRTTCFSVTASHLPQT